jgi:hypothetical protein
MHPLSEHPENPADSQRIHVLLNLWRLYGFDLYAWDGDTARSIVIRARGLDGHLDPRRQITGCFDNSFQEWISAMTSRLIRDRSEYSINITSAKTYWQTDANI